MTIRTVHKDTITALPYARENMFGFVLYFNVKFNDKDNEILQKTTMDLIDAAERAGGTYYLPYQVGAFWTCVRLWKALSFPRSQRTIGMRRGILPAPGC